MKINGTLTPSSGDRPWYIPLLVLAPLSIFLFSLHLMPWVAGHFVKGIDISTGWEFCVLGSGAISSEKILTDIEIKKRECVWKPTKLPTNRFSYETGLQEAWVLFRVKFETSADFDFTFNRYRLFIADAESFEAYLNSQFIGGHGSLPPHYQYAQVFAANLPLPTNYMKPKGQTNDLSLLLYSSGFARAGIAGKPIAILSYPSAHLMGELLGTAKVLLPLLCVLGLLVLLGFGLTQYLTEEEKNPKLLIYIIYTVVSSFFLLGLTRLPREFFDISLVIGVQYPIRCAYDIAYLKLIEHLFGRRTLVGKVCFFGIITVLIVLLLNLFSAAQLLDSATVDQIMKYYLFISFVPSILAIFESNERRKVTTSGILLFSVFLAVFLMNINDVLGFWGIIPERYFARFFPLIIALAAGYAIWEEYMKKRYELEREASFGRLAAQVAHDIRSPVAALKMLTLQEKQTDAARTEILNTVISRISGIADDLRQKVGSVLRSDSKPVLTIVDLQKLSEDLLREKRLEYQHRPEIELTFKSHIGDEGIFTGLRIDQYRAKPYSFELNQ